MLYFILSLQQTKKRCMSMLMAWCLDTAENLYLHFILWYHSHIFADGNCKGGYCPLLTAARRKTKGLQVSVGWYSPHSRGFKTSSDTKGNDIKQTALGLASHEYKISSIRVLCPHNLSRSPYIKYKGKVVSLHAMKANRGREGQLHSFLTSAAWRL